MQHNCMLSYLSGLRDQTLLGFAGLEVDMRLDTCRLFSGESDLLSSPRLELYLRRNFLRHVCHKILSRHLLPLFPPLRKFFGILDRCVEICALGVAGSGFGPLQSRFCLPDI
jgi:hypothetical protein